MVIQYAGKEESGKHNLMLMVAGALKGLIYIVFLPFAGIIMFLILFLKKAARETNRRWHIRSNDGPGYINHSIIRRKGENNL